MRRRRSAPNLWSVLGKSAARSAKRVQREVTRAVTTAVVRQAVKQTNEVSKATQRVLSGIASPAPPPKSRGGGRWEEGVWGLGPLAQRRYRLFIPAGVTASRPAPLMLLLHGCGQDAASFAASTRVAAIARAQRCVVLMPEQSQQANAQRCWNWFRSSVRVAGEATLLMAIVDHVCRHHPIRSERVFAFGLSAGGAMALTLALRFPDRFAAVGSHSGASPHSANNAAQAARAMQGRGAGHSQADIHALRLHLAGRTLPPLVLVHGDADHVVSFDNAMASASLWVELAAPAVPQLKPLRGVQRGARRPHIVYDWQLDGQPYIHLVRVQGLAHAWSGGTARQAFSDPEGPDALRLVFAFFDRLAKAGAALKPGRRKRVA